MACSRPWLGALPRLPSEEMICWTVSARHELTIRDPCCSLFRTIESPHINRQA
jgi:hypothetical protein